MFLDLCLVLVLQRLILQNFDQKLPDKILTTSNLIFKFHFYPYKKNMLFNPHKSRIPTNLPLLSSTCINAVKNILMALMYKYNPNI